MREILGVFEVFLGIFENTKERRTGLFVLPTYLSEKCKVLVFCRSDLLTRML